MEAPARYTAPSRLMMKAMSASHSRAAEATSVSRTVRRSKVDRLMVLRTSPTAACCCKTSVSCRLSLEVSDAGEGLRPGNADSVGFGLRDPGDFAAPDLRARGPPRPAAVARFPAPLLVLVLAIDRAP